MSLGSDLSIDLPAPLASFTVHKKVLPKVKLCVQTGSYSQTFALPTQLGEVSSAYEVATETLEFTVGYYINVKGAGYNPDAGSKS